MTQPTPDPVPAPEPAVAPAAAPTFLKAEVALPQPLDFEQDLASLLNRHCKENGSNTPDFLLASFLQDVLTQFDDTVKARAQWYGRIDRPGESAPSGVARAKLELLLRWAKGEEMLPSTEMGGGAQVGCGSPAGPLGSRDVRVRTLIAVLEAQLETLPKEPTTVAMSVTDGAQVIDAKLERDEARAQADRVVTLWHMLAHHVRTKRREAQGSHKSEVADALADVLQHLESGGTRIPLPSTPERAGPEEPPVQWLVRQLEKMETLLRSEHQDDLEHVRRSSTGFARVVRERFAPLVQAVADGKEWKRELEEHIAARVELLRVGLVQTDETAAQAVRRHAEAVKSAETLRRDTVLAILKQEADRLRRNRSQCSSPEEALSKSIYQVDKCIVDVEKVASATPDLTLAGDGVGAIAREREKQRKKWGDAHDDEHRDGLILGEAMALVHSVQRPNDPIASQWGLVAKHPQPMERMVIAGALIAAEIDRRIRAKNSFVQAENEGNGDAVLPKAIQPKGITRRSGSVFVDADCGDDRNPGTADQPVKTWERAARLLGAPTGVPLDTGQNREGWRTARGELKDWTVSRLEHEALELRWRRTKEHLQNVERSAAALRAKVTKLRSRVGAGPEQQSLSLVRERVDKIRAMAPKRETEIPGLDSSGYKLWHLCCDEIDAAVNSVASVVGRRQRSNSAQMAASGGGGAVSAPQQHPNPLVSGGSLPSDPIGPLVRGACDGLGLALRLVSSLPVASSVGPDTYGARVWNDYRDAAIQAIGKEISKLLGPNAGVRLNPFMVDGEGRPLSRATPEHRHTGGYPTPPGFTPPTAPAEPGPAIFRRADVPPAATDRRLALAQRVADLKRQLRELVDELGKGDLGGKQQAPTAPTAPPAKPNTPTPPAS